jgi:uncharacterized membrane protein YidH (DUF202 family)
MRRWTDPPAGLAGERTALAWQRSALVLVVVAALLLHAAGSGARLVFAGAAVAYALGAALAWRAGERLYALRADGRAHRAPRELRMMSAASVLAALLALVVALTH